MKFQLGDLITGTEESGEVYGLTNTVDSHYFKKLHKSAPCQCVSELSSIFD